MTPERRAEIEAALKADQAFFKKNSFTNWRGNAWQAALYASMQDREELLRELEQDDELLSNDRPGGEE